MTAVSLARPPVSRLSSGVEAVLVDQCVVAVAVEFEVVDVGSPTGGVFVDVVGIAA